MFLSLPRSLQIYIAQGMFDCRGWIEEEHVGPSVAAWVREEVQSLYPACVHVGSATAFLFATSLLTDVIAAVLWLWL